jgi:hypothetical protein
MTEFIHGFSQILQANPAIVPSYRPRPLNYASSKFIIYKYISFDTENASLKRRIRGIS